MARSDVESSKDNPSTSGSKTMVGQGRKMVVDRPEASLPIHSGHFMVSCVHDENENDDVDELEVGSPSEIIEVKEEPIKLQDDEPRRRGYDFSAAAVKSPKNEYAFGDRTVESFGIDGSLTKLFDCMTLAYR